MKQLMKKTMMSLVALMIIFLAPLIARAESVPVTIISQPQDQVWEVGSEASFKIGAVGENLKYQWQVKFLRDSEFKNALAPSAKTSNYHFTMQNGHKSMKVRCLITNKNGEIVESKVVTVLEQAVKPRITYQPQDTPWDYSKNASFLIMAIGDDLTYQWQVRFAGKTEFKNALSETAKTNNFLFAMQFGHQEMEVRCVITDKYGNSVTSKTAKCTWQQPEKPEFVKQPRDLTFNIGEEAEFEAIAVGDNISYQWQVRFVGKSEFQNALAPSAKTSNYHFTMKNGHPGMEVRCVATDKKGNSVTSEIVKVKEFESGLNKITLSGNRNDHLITKQYCYVEGEKFFLLLDKDLDIPGDLADNVALIMDELENLMGLSFLEPTNDDAVILMGGLLGEPWQDLYFGMKVPIYIWCDRYNEGWISGATENGVNIYMNSLMASEYLVNLSGTSYCEYDLFAHELTHVLTLRHAWYSRITAEGIADYYAWKVMKVLADRTEDFHDSLASVIDNYESIDDAYKEQLLNDISSENAENCFVLDYEDPINRIKKMHYAYGRIFYAYLDRTYEKNLHLNYSKAMRKTGLADLYGTKTKNDMIQYVNVIKEVFGENVFIEFAAWYQENHDKNIWK
ncbi:MAG: hypothetical protein K6F51_02980 [Acetatifactor sp.]|nr:hypothetical protein [Acetatifactor sp.]